MLSNFSEIYQNVKGIIRSVYCKYTWHSTIMKYIEVKQAAGVDPGWLKPAHLNAKDIVIKELLQISQQLG